MIKQETFTTEENLEVTVSIKNKEYGWFELYDDEWHAEGSLEIEDKNIVGYDGVFSLPEPITNKLKEWGYNTDDVE